MHSDDFTREVLPLKNKIFRLALRLVTVHAEAEDITQEVFIKLWNKKNELHNCRSIEAFAMTITKNLCLDKLKSKKNVVVELPGQDIATLDGGPHKQAEATNHRMLMNEIIARLPEQQKSIIHLREIEGYEFEEIAEITGLQINAVRVNLSRARKTIKDELTKIHNYGLEIY
jgi:RNA polymerase sigma-70 factor, ECF subfamily